MLNSGAKRLIVWALIQRRLKSPSKNHGCYHFVYIVCNFRWNENKFSDWMEIALKNICYLDRDFPT